MSNAAKLALMLLCECQALLVPPAPSVQQVTMAAVGQAPAMASSGPASVFPSSILLADEPPVSPAKAKIEAAKKAAAAKLAERGVEAPEAKALEIDDASGGKQKDPFAEADALKAKLRALEESAGPKKSKSQSAQIEQVRMMEKKARGQARAIEARKVEIENKRDAERNEPASFNKISPIKLPF